MLVGSVGPQQQGSCISSVNAFTGQSLWSYQCPQPSGQGGTTDAFQGAVVSARDGAIFFSSSSSLIALEPSGTRRWVSQLTGSTYSYSPGGLLTAPALSADGFTIFVGCAGSMTNAARLFGLDNGSGAILWSVRAPADVTGVAAGVGGGVVYSALDATLRFVNETGSRASARRALFPRVRALTPQPAAPPPTAVWATPLAARTYPRYYSGAPVVAANGTIYAIAPNGALFSFNSSDGTVGQVADPDAGVASVQPSSMPVVTAGAVYYTSPIGELRAIVL